MHQAFTHVLQKSNVETEDTALEFMEFMRCKVANMNPDHVLNIDQTPIPFTFHAKCTWETKGMQTVHVHGSTSEKKGNTRSHCHNEMLALTPISYFQRSAK